MKNRHLSDSFKNAGRGIVQAFKTERNIKLHTLATFTVLFFAFVLDFTLLEFIVLVMLITIVIVAELLNTAVEYTVDMVCGDNYDKLAKYAKDIAAGATLIAAIGAIIVGLLLYIPKLIKLLLL
jgi:diacylglycerol kinase (ATP)